MILRLIGSIAMLAGIAALPAAAAGPAASQPASQPDGTVAIRVCALNADGCRLATPAKLAQAIARHRADVVFLAEVSDLQADAIAAALGLHRAVTAPLARPADSLETAVLCRWPLGEIHILRTPQRAFGVVCTTIPPKISPPAQPRGTAATAGPTLNLIAVHLLSTHPGPLMKMVATIRERTAEGGVLADAIGKLAGPAIVGGDFNEGPQLPSLAALAGRLDNAFNKAGRGPDVTFPGFAGGIRIDHILFTAGLRAEDCFVDQAEISDHRMVVATLRLAGRTGRQSTSSQPAR